VRGLVGAIPEQVELSKAANPAAVKLSVDPYLRVIGEPPLPMPKCFKRPTQQLDTCQDVRGNLCASHYVSAGEAMCVRVLAQGPGV
jgi:hypothetical protein